VGGRQDGSFRTDWVECCWTEGNSIRARYFGAVLLRAGPRSKEYVVSHFVGELSVLAPTRNPGSSYGLELEGGALEAGSSELVSSLCATQGWIVRSPGCVRQRRWCQAHCSGVSRIQRS